jgi:hypothetical protein
VMVGPAMATAPPRQMMLYSCRGSTGFSTVVSPLATCAKHRYTHPADALQLYSALQPLQLYSSTSSTQYNPLQHPSGGGPAPQRLRPTPVAPPLVAGEPRARGAQASADWDCRSALYRKLRTKHGRDLWATAPCPVRRLPAHLMR